MKVLSGKYSTKEDTMILAKRQWFLGHWRPLVIIYHPDRPQKPTTSPHQIERKEYFFYSLVQLYIEFLRGNCNFFQDGEESS